MSSSVFFKFKSQKEPSRVTFDGTGISVFELKREIITINRLGDGNDFDLAIFNEDTNEEYDDDTTIIPRSTSIVAKRLPPARANRGSAARYVTGKMPVTAKNSSRIEKSTQKEQTLKTTTSIPASHLQVNGAQTEEERIAAMLNADAEQWDQQKKEMAYATPVYRAGAGRGKALPSTAPNNPPPSGYVCYRCGEKGHWIQQCPTNDDPNFDGRPRVKRTTGIPRSFLRTVAKPDALSKDSAGDGVIPPSGVMVNAEGEFVVAEPDSASWAQFQAKAKASEIAQELAAKGNKELQDLGLECSIDKRLFVNPTKTPCCENTYCNDCITNALLEGDLTCPSCHTEGIILDELSVNEDMVSKVKAYVEKQQSKLQEDSKGSKGSEEASSVGDDSKKVDIMEKGAESQPQSNGQNGILTVPRLAEASLTDTPNRASTLTPDAKSTTSNGSKKRPAEGELDNDRIPKAPAAMRQQQAMMNQGGQGSAPFGANGTPQSYNLGLSGMSNVFPTNGMNYGFSNANVMMGMPGSMGPMMPMATGTINPMMNMNGYGGYNAMGYNGMGYNGMVGNAGFNQMSMLNMGMPNMGMGAMPNMNMNGVPMMPQQNKNPQTGQNGVFPNQQRSGTAENGGEEDNAYFRQPVNPHRHQGRQQRRARPSDYREL